MPDIITKKSRKKYAVCLLALILTACAVFFVNLGGLLVPALESGESIPPDFGDVILVLGGGLRPKVRFGFSTQERLELAMDLYRKKARTVIVSDGSLYKKSPALPVIHKYLSINGVRPEHIILEGKSQTTLENCMNGLEIIRSAGFVQPVICTSPYHQARTRLICRALGYKNFKIAKMKHSEIYHSPTVTRRLRNLRLVFREFLGIVRFRVFRR